MTVRDSFAWLFDRLLPERSREDATLRFRAELIMGFGAFELLATAVFSAAELSLGTPAIGLIYAVSCVPMFAILAWARSGGDVNRAGSAFMTVLFLSISAVNFGAGGRAIGANIALPTVVLFGVLMSSPRVGLFWTLAVVVEILIVAGLRRSGYVFPIQPNMVWVGHAIDRVPLFLSLVSALIAVVILRALTDFRTSLEQARATEASAREVAAYNAARFVDFAEIAADGFWETDADLRLTYVSPSFAEAMGLAPEQMLGLTPEQAYRVRFPELPDLTAYMAPLRAHEPFDGQLLQMVNRAGYQRVLLNQGLPIRDDRGAFLGYRGAVQDVTAQRAAEKALRGSERRLRLITDHLPAFIVHVDRDERYTFANAYTGQTMAVAPSTIVGKRLIEVLGPTYYAEVKPHVDAVLRGETQRFEIVREYAGDRRYHFDSTYVPDVDAAGNVVGFYVMSSDITQLKRVEEELRNLSEIDGLTGLANRTRLNTVLTDAVARSERSGKTMALTFLDIDRFKSINDSLGHHAGDLVLQEFARRLSRCTRQTDLVARLAGDEFVIVLEGMHAPEGMEIVAQKILAAMTPPFDILEQSLPLSASIGIAYRRPGEHDCDELFRRADAALYAAKAAGRGTYRIGDAAKVPGEPAGQPMSANDSPTN